jgi:hypothetical protein
VLKKQPSTSARAAASESGSAHQARVCTMLPRAA